MKPLFPLCLLALILTGCLHRARNESFESLHARVAASFSSVCDCGPITKSDLVKSNDLFIGPYFEVCPKDSAIKIIVCERPFYTQTEWRQKFDKGAKQFDDFAALAKSGGVPQFSPVTKDWVLLPDWSYKSTGVDVQMLPDITSQGVAEKDKEQAYNVYRQILSLLTKYE
jgi:hypothetical protein